MKNFLLMAFLISLSSVFAQDVDSYIELLKTDVKSEKKAIITEVMKFDEKQAEVF